MPTLSLTQNEAEFFGLKSEKPEVRSQKKPAHTNTKNNQVDSSGIAVKTFIAILSFVAGGGIVYSYLNTELQHSKSQNLTYSIQLKSLSTKIAGLQTQLAAEKEKARVISAPEFPMSFMFKEQAITNQAAQPQQSIVEKPQERPRKIAAPQPAPNHLKTGAVNTHDKTPAAPVSAAPQQQHAAEQKEPPPKFLPVLMMPASKLHVASVDEASIAWRMDNGAKKTIKVGEALPTGETLMGVDPTSSTFWTEKQIISIIKE